MLKEAKQEMMSIRDMVKKMRTLPCNEAIFDIINELQNELERREEILEYFRKKIEEYVKTNYSLFIEDYKDKYNNDFEKYFYRYFDAYGWLKWLYDKNYRFLYSFDDFKVMFYDKFLDIVKSEVRKYTK